MAGAHDAVAEDHALDELALLVDAHVVQGVDALVVGDDDDRSLVCADDELLALDDLGDVADVEPARFLLAGDAFVHASLRLGQPLRAGRVGLRQASAS